MSAGELTRRSLLAASLTLAASACSGPDGAPDPRPRVADPDARVRRDIADEIRVLRARYAATAERHPGLAGRLEPLMSEHDVHLRVITRAGPGRSSASTPEASQTAPRSAATAGATAAPVDVARRASAALTALVRAEQAAALRRVRQVRAASPQLARLVAAIGASNAAHAALLSRST